MLSQPDFAASAGSAQRSRTFFTARTFRPKPYEVDFTGFLSNTTVVRWMEDLRIALMDAHFPNFSTGERRNLSVIVHAEIRYCKPIRYHDLVDGGVWLEELRRSRFIVAFEFCLAAERCIAIAARQSGAFVDSATLRPVAVPDEIATAVKQKLCGAPLKAR